MVSGNNVGTTCAQPDPDHPAASQATSSPPVSNTRRATLIAVVTFSALTLFVFREVVPAALLGAWVAGITEPLTVRIARRFGGRTRAASMMTLALVLVLAGTGAALLIPVVSELRSLARSMRTLLSSADPVTAIGQTLQTHEPQAHAHAVALGLLRDVGPLATEAFALGGAIVMQFVAFVATAYYLSIDGRRLQAGLERVSPLGPENTRAFLAEFIAVGRGIMISMGTAAVATSIALGTTYVACNVPRAGLCTAFTFVAAMMPVGAPLVWVPIAALLLTYGRVGAAVAVTAVGLGIVSLLIDHVLRPWLVRFGRLTLHPLLVFLGLIGGVIAFGAWGVFLGPLLVAMTATALRVHVQRPILARRSVVPGERVTQVSIAPAVASSMTPAVPPAIPPAT